MHALILAGGGGTRLDLGEKSLVTLQGRPMIEYVVDAFRAAGHEVIVVLTKKTPYTRNWCRACGVAHITASGSGYIEDIGEAAEFLELMNPFFTCGADLPCLRPVVIREIEENVPGIGKRSLLGMGPKGSGPECRMPLIVYRNDQRRSCLSRRDQYPERRPDRRTTGRIPAPSP